MRRDIWDRGAPHDARVRLFEGAGTVRVWDLQGEAAAIEPFEAVLACELDPGGSVGAHTQPDCAEIVLGMEGRGVARVDGGDRPLAPGAVVGVPLGSVLSIANGSRDAPLRYLIVKARAETRSHAEPGTSV